MNTAELIERMSGGCAMNSEIKIGSYSIARFDSKSIWIENAEGEGMQTTDEKLEAVIDKFFKKNF